MPALTAGDLAILRRKPVGRDWKIYTYVPALLWGGTLNGAHDQGATELDVVTVSGNPADILADCTVRVTDSASNLKIKPSKVRAKSYDAPSTTLTVAENAIEWAAGDIITAMRVFELWPRVVYIDPASREQYKDQDIDYTDDAAAQPPKANGGPAVIGMLEGGVCDITFRDEGSFTVPTGGAPSSYLWTALGGTPAVQAGALASTWVTLRYTTAGYYYMQYEVTDANGETGVRYIPVIIDDGTKHSTRIGVGDRYWDRHGWVLSRKWLGIDLYSGRFVDGLPTFLVSDGYGTVPGAFADNRARLRWSGWLSEETVDNTAYRRTVTYRAVSSAHILQNIPAYSAALYDDSDPDAGPNWYFYSDLSVDSATYLLMKWNTTAMEVCDWHPTGEWTSRAILAEESELDDVLSQINKLLQAVFGDLRCDRQGILRSIRHEWHLSAAEQAARATVLTLDPQDYERALLGPRKHHSTVRSVTLSGTDSSGDPYMSGAPGDFILDGGRPIEVGNLAVVDQDELNQWAGQHLAFANWAAPIRLRMTGEYDVVDPALGEYVQGNLYQFDTLLPLTGPYSVVGARFHDDHGRGVTIGEWLILPDPKEYPGATVDIPEEPPAPTPSDPPDDFSPPIEEDFWPSIVYVATTTGGVYITTNFQGPGGAMPAWSAINDIDSDSNTMADYGVHWFSMDESDPENRQFLIDHTNYGLYRREGGDWFSNLTANAAAALCGVAMGQGGRLGSVCVDPVTGYVWTTYVEIDGTFSRIFALYSIDNGDTWAGGQVREPAGFASWFDGEIDAHDGAVIRAYNSNVWVSCRKSNTPAGCPGSRGHMLYHSSNNGANWPAAGGLCAHADYVIMNQTTSSTFIPHPGWGHCMNRGALGRVYGVRYELGAAVYDPVYVTIPVGANGLIEPTLDLGGPFGAYPRGADQYWFDPNDSTRAVYVAQGYQTDALLARLCLTEDAFFTPSTKYELDFYNIDSQAHVVSTGSNFLLLGARECDDGGPNMTHHHILAVDLDMDPREAVERAGSNPETGVDSIPHDAGGMAFNGIGVVI